MIRNLTILALVATACATTSTALARGNANLSRRDIRQMPILERPSRPGHFYGNAVRRRNSRPAGPVMQGNSRPVYSQSPQTRPVVQQGGTPSTSTEF